MKRRHGAPAAPPPRSPSEGYGDHVELIPVWAAAWDAVAGARRHALALQRRMHDGAWTAETLPRVYNDVAQALAAAVRPMATYLRTAPPGTLPPRTADLYARDLRGAWSIAKGLHAQARALAKPESLSWRALKDRTDARERRGRMASAERTASLAVREFDRARDLIATSSKQWSTGSAFRYAFEAGGVNLATALDELLDPAVDRGPAWSQPVAQGITEVAVVVQLIAEAEVS